MGILFLNCIVKNHKKIQQKYSHRNIIFYNSLYYSYCEETYKNSFANIPPRFSYHFPCQEKLTN